MKDHYCMFCKIAGGDTRAQVLFEDQQVVAFKDINPQAPIHVLVIPREHFDSIKEMIDETLIGHLFTAAKTVAKQLGVTDYRLVLNTGPQSGQSVFHTHLHLLAGRTMHWPPG